MGTRDERDGVIAGVDQLRHEVHFRAVVTILAAEVETELGEFRGRKNEVRSERVDDDEDDLTDDDVGKVPAVNQVFVSWSRAPKITEYQHCCSANKSYIMSRALINLAKYLL